MSETSNATSAWNVESVRLTVFHSSALDATDGDWWERIAGIPPETKNFRPRDGVHEVQGAYLDGTLSFRAMAGRFDWILAAPASSEPPASGFPVFGTYTDISDRFATLLRPWLKSIPEATRVAFGAIVLQPANDKVSGYKLLAEYLPSVRVDPEKSSDFSYQINRPRALSELGGIRINRLSRWSVALVQRLVLVVGGAGLTKAESVGGPGKTAVRVELDLSTDAEALSPMSEASRDVAFKNLLRFSDELLTKGDVE